MKKVYLLIIIIIAIIVVAGVYYITGNQQPTPTNGEPPIIEDKISREEIMVDVSKKIAEISPQKPVLGGKWHVNRFWFVQDSNKNFYVEYEDGHIFRQILVEAEKKEGKLNYKVIGYFEPGETTWDLKQGEDKFFGSLLDLYEYDEELGKWIRKN